MTKKKCCRNCLLFFDCNLSVKKDEINGICPMYIENLFLPEEKVDVQGKRK